MKFLIIAQDLRVSGTSEGIVSRSFLVKLRQAYPEAVIDVLYLHLHEEDDNLDLLPVNSLISKRIITLIPSHIRWINRLTTRILNFSYAENYNYKKFAKEISKVNYLAYDHIMVRSAGVSHETILALYELPILKHTTINFHDPYPNLWYRQEGQVINPTELNRLQKIIKIVNSAKSCCSSAYYMSNDLQYLYASKKAIHYLPHQFAADAFDLSDYSRVRFKTKKIQISYHGALMLGRNTSNIVQAFNQLVKENQWIKDDVELVFRVKGKAVKNLKDDVADSSNIFVLDTLDFVSSSIEQATQSDITIILENGPHYCNISSGKIPFLISLNKKIFITSPQRSEMRHFLPNYPFLADMNSIEDTKNRLFEIIKSKNVVNEELILLFSDTKFKEVMDKIFNN